METRHQSKRRWQSSPGKKARVELDFGQNTPSPKRIRLSTPAEPLMHKSEGNNADSFTIKSFYGKREKIHFPHSPGRRRAVDKVLDKVSVENTDSENEKPGQKRLASAKHSKNDKELSKFDFHSSDSADNESEGQNRRVLREKTEQNSSKKVPLKIVRSVKTPKHYSDKKELTKSTGKIPNKNQLVKEHEMTPSTTGKKFFKSRSPASADKCFGNLVIKKGFDLKFYPKRLNLSKNLKLVKADSKSACKKTKTKNVDKVKASKAKVFDCNSVFFVEDSCKLDGSELNDGEIETVNNTSDMDVSDIKGHSKEVGEDIIEKSDSGVDTSNSNDLFSSPLEGTDVDNRPDQSEEKNSRQAVSMETELENKSENASETVSLIGAGSEDLFPNSGRSTPQKVCSGENTPIERTPVQSAQGSPSGSSTASTDETVKSKPLKLFPVFMKKSPTSSQLGKSRGKTSPSGSKSPGGSVKNSPLLKYVKSKDNLEQMIIDAGQKRYGATQCEVCGMVYTMSEPADETMHYKFHQSFLNALKFPGWKKEHVVQEYMDTGSRVIMITADSPKYATRKVDEISKIMGEELGFPEANFTSSPSFKTFLYISEDKRIEGCCVTEPVSEGYRVLPETQSSQPSQTHPGHRPWCCSDEPETALIGVSRIWVYSQARRKGVATRLLDCVRQWSVYGTVIPKGKMAFSDPTPDGKQLATRYIGTPSFLVYKYH